MWHECLFVAIAVLFFCIIFLDDVPMRHDCPYVCIGLDAAASSFLFWSLSGLAADQEELSNRNVFSEVSFRGLQIVANS